MDNQSVRITGVRISEGLLYVQSGLSGRLDLALQGGTANKPWLPNMCKYIIPQTLLQCCYSLRSSGGYSFALLTVYVKLITGILFCEIVKKVAARVFCGFNFTNAD